MQTEENDALICQNEQLMDETSEIKKIMLKVLVLRPLHSFRNTRSIDNFSLNLG